ncbi:MAG: hypothetical protein WEB57_00685 [Pseudohongiellaceae bacterium]
MAEKLIAYVDMDDTLCDYSAGYQLHRERYPGHEYPQGEPGLYVDLEPMPGAIEAYSWLNCHPMLDVYILTAPSVRNAHSYAEKRIWVERHLGLDAAYRLVITPNKGLSKGDFLVDDYTEGKGQERFEGKIIQFGSQEFPDWSSVIRFFDNSLGNLSNL